MCAGRGEDEVPPGEQVGGEQPRREPVPLTAVALQHPQGLAVDLRSVGGAGSGGVDRHVESGRGGACGQQSLGQRRATHVPCTHRHHGKRHASILVGGEVASPLLAPASARPRPAQRPTTAARDHGVSLRPAGRRDAMDRSVDARGVHPQARDATGRSGYPLVPGGAIMRVAARWQGSRATLRLTHCATIRLTHRATEACASRGRRSSPPARRT